MRIGVLTPFVGGWYHGGVLSGIARAAGGVGASVVVLQAEVAGAIARGISGVTDQYGSLEEVQERIHLRFPVAWDHVAGFVVLAPVASTPYVTSLISTGRPIIVVGHQPAGVNCTVVLPDNAGGAYRAVKHMIEHGHTRIAFAGLMTDPDVLERHQGYLAALRKHGIDPEPRLLYEAEERGESGGAGAARKMISAGLPSTAVVAGTDVTAIGIMNTLRGAGYGVPGQQAVIGFDDIEYAVYNLPMLSTVRSSAVHSGAVAVAELLHRLKTESPGGSPAVRRTPTYLALRESCGCAGQGIQPTDRSSTSDRSHAADTPWRGLSDRIYDAVASYVASPDAADGLRAAVDLVAHAATDPRAAYTADELNSTLETMVRLTGRASTLLDIADVMRTNRSESAVDSGGDGAASSTLFVMFRAHARVKHDIVEMVLHGLGTQQEVSAELFLRQGRDPRRLGWLAATTAGAGCLGLWATGMPPTSDDPTSNQDVMLDIAGTFVRTGRLGIADASHIRLSAFPPAELIDLGRARDGELTFVVPVKIGASDWGLLAVVDSVQSTLIYKGQESVNQWATLLTVALDREQVLQELRVQEEELRSAALHDHLTGLPNRMMFLNRLSQAVQRAKRDEGHHFCVLYFDLDGFKRINDTLGHPAGDRVLVQVAERITALLRPPDTAARLGGDEFVILLDGIDDFDVPAQMARRLESTLSSPMRVNGKDIRVTVSIGAALGAAGHRDAHEVLRDADRAMYTAKRRSRGRRP